MLCGDKQGGMKVYISHSRRDAAAASVIVAAIRQAGHEALFDRDELIPGANFKAAIIRMIDEADIVLVVWSTAAASSSFIHAEAQQALELGKYLGFMLGDTSLPAPFNLLSHHRLGLDGSEPSHGLIAQAIETMASRPAPSRLAGRISGSGRTRSFAPAPEPPPQRAGRQAMAREEGELDIPSFLRRQADDGPAPPAADLAPASSAPMASAETGAASGERDYDVFISYSRKDTDACKLAFNLMAERGLVPWYDKDTGAGMFKSTIVTQISKAAVFVLLLSKNSVGSSNVSKELSIAVNSGRLVVPISIDGITPDELVGTFQYELIELNIFTADPKIPETWSDVIKTVADSAAAIRAEAGEALPVAAPVRPLALAAPSPAAASPPKGRRPFLFLGMTLVSGLLQQAAVGFALWTAGVADVTLAVALAIASGAVIWPLAYGAAALARLAFRRPGG